MPKRIEILNLSHNQIKILPLVCRYFCVLDISFNKIVELPKWKNMFIKHLNLSHNRLIDLPIELKYSWSPELPKGFTWISIGFWF